MANAHSVTCQIRYTLDFNKLSAFETYARTWTVLVERYGGIHHGYFIPNKLEGGEMEITFAISGVSDPSREMSILMYAIMLGNLAITKAVAAFRDRLNEAEVLQLVTSLTDANFNFFNDYLSTVHDLGKERRAFELLSEEWRKMYDSAHTNSQGP